MKRRRLRSLQKCRNLRDQRLHLRDIFRTPLHKEHLFTADHLAVDLFEFQRGFQLPHIKKQLHLRPFGVFHRLFVLGDEIVSALLADAVKLQIGEGKLRKLLLLDLRQRLSHHDIFIPLIGVNTTAVEPRLPAAGDIVVYERAGDEGGVKHSEIYTAR